MKKLDDNCIFCKIIKNEIPSIKIYEDDDVLAFMDISQTTKGHTLLIPKEHVENIFEYDNNLGGIIFSRVPKIAKAIKNSDSKIKGMNICQNNGEVAYQSVMHSHLHLIPRYSDKDGFSMKFTDNTENYTKNDLEDIANKIKQSIED